MKGSWLQCLLGDVITLKRGYDLPHDARVFGSYPIVSSSGITDYHVKAKVKGPGVVTGRYGTLGEVFYITQDFWPLNTSLYVQDFKGNDPQFIAYFLRTLNFETQNAAGAVPGINRNHLHTIVVNIPTLPLQHRIASILSAYDDLIENCQRRIRILEDMARSLYREWFVKFRFPGHEQVKMVSSPLGDIPEGWEVEKLGAVVELNYGKALKKEDRQDGEFSVFGSSGIVGTHNVALVKGPGIIVGRKGNVGSVFWCDEDFFVIDTAYFVTSNLPLRFLFYVLPTLNFINSDAAVPGLSRNQAYTLDIIVPPLGLLEKFCDLADVFEWQVATLQYQIQNLRRTRDLLLPRLMSGQLEVKAG